MGKKLLVSKACSTISDTSTATKFYIPMLQTSNLAVLLMFFLLFPFLAFTKCQVLNLRVGLGHIAYKGHIQSRL